LVTFGIAHGDSLTDSDLQLFIKTEQDPTRHTFIQYISKKMCNSNEELVTTDLEKAFVEFVSKLMVHPVVYYNIGYCDKNH
jgi:hypothetical protein